MPALLKRLLFQVGPHPNERTFTLSSVSTDGHYISLRPFVKPSGDELSFPFGRWVWNSYDIIFATVFCTKIAHSFCHC